MGRNTKEKILDAALEIFARDGYAGTNIKDIAESVGIVKSALYRHFESKAELWDAVIQRMEAYYGEHFGSTEKLPAVPESTDELYDMTMAMVDFTVHDRKVILMRRILTTEQFRTESIRDLASRHFLYDTEAIFTKVFERMMENGSLKKDDPAILAFSYTAPITALIHLCDRDPGKEKEAMEQLNNFIEHFIRTFGEVTG